MILWDDGFFTELEDARLCYIGGRLGAGKTLLALKIAERFLRRGYKLLTNINSVWNDEWPEKIDEEGKVKAVAIVDEGGLYIRSMASVAALSSFSRKLDMYVIICGKREPHGELTELYLAPWFDGRRNLGIPVYIWRWDVEAGRKNYHGYIAEGPRDGLYGVYDTVNPGRHASVLVEHTKEYARQLFEKFGERYVISDVETGGGDNGSADAMVDQNKNSRSVRDAVAVLASKARR